MQPQQSPTTRHNGNLNRDKVRQAEIFLSLRVGTKKPYQGRSVRSSHVYLGHVDCAVGKASGEIDPLLSSPPQKGNERCIFIVFSISLPQMAHKLHNWR